MGHRCCSKLKVKRGLWSPEEDDKLMKHITTHGHGSWSSVPKLAGLQRCGKSCRLRWINYLRPDLKKGSFTEEEEQIIIDVHRILGNRWAQIAKHLPGRTDNEVKNFWNSCIKKKLMSQGLDPQTHNLISSHQNRASNSSTNYKKNGLNSFVVSHNEQNQEPISVFSLSSSSSSQEITNVICSDQVVLKNPVTFDLTPPNYAISTVDSHHQYQNAFQIDNNTTNYFQQCYNIPSSSSSSFSSHVDAQNPSRSCNLLDHDLGIWGSSFEPSFETPGSLEANPQSLQGHDHDNYEQIMVKQLHDHDHDKKDQIQNNDERSNDHQKYSSFDLGFMESALMSDVMCTNDFSSMEYDIAWNC